MAIAHVYRHLVVTNGKFLYCYWYVVVKNGSFTLFVTSSGQEWHFCHEIHRKTFIFWVNLGMWCLKSIVLKNKPCYEGFNTHLWGFWGDRWENVHFESKLRHVTPQINRLGKMSTVVRGLNIHFWGFSGDRWENVYFFQ